MENDASATTSGPHDAGLCSLRSLPVSSDEVSVIDRWRVDGVLDALRKGRTRGLVLQCSRKDGTQRDLVVKTLDKGISETGLFCEFFGNVVARAVGLNTPEPSLVHIDLDAAALINSSGAVRAIDKTVPPGLAVGCTYLRPAPLPPRTDGLSVAQVEEAALIYAFDLLVHHPDRLVDNPNVLMFREHFIAIDFDLTFSFLWDILGGIEAWEVSKLRFPEHYFRQLLRASAFIKWENVVHKALSFETADLEGFVQALPDQWHDAGARAVRHLRDVQSHEADFRWELMRTLS